MRVDVWSDISCPWCYVGKSRFGKAVERFGREVEVRHRSFELDPSRGTEETEQVVAMLSRKYGMSAEQAQAGEHRLQGLAAAEGLEYRAEGRDHGGSFDIHRLLHLAAERGLADRAWQAFYTANFAEEASLFSRDRIAEVAVGAGLDRDEVLAVLDDPAAYGDAVRADEAEAASLGANGVPFFVIDGKYGVSGAQPTEVFAEILEKAWSEREPKLTTLGGDSEACGPDGCAL
ncbi:DsbA family protein [Glycomyces tenuis]|uniref:DsbA family protein n=2 Tax=Glycomyces tenuis TaxID=58116 RepID=UPI00047E63EC